VHELGLTRNIVAIVTEAAKGRRVRRVTLEVGRLSGVMSEAIAFCFQIVAEGTVLSGAELEIRDIEGRGHCRECEAEFDMPDLLTPCGCGSHAISRLQGDEFKVKSMELDEAA
jgi:hydrogenase nickel incorporation protein HypA/HybF